MTRRPNPEGEPHFDLQIVLDSCDEYFESARELTEATGKLQVHDLLEAAYGMSWGTVAFVNGHSPMLRNGLALVFGRS